MKKLLVLALCCLSAYASQEVQNKTPEETAHDYAQRIIREVKARNDAQNDKLREEFIKDRQERRKCMAYFTSLLKPEFKGSCVKSISKLDSAGRVHSLYLRCPSPWLPLFSTHSLTLEDLTSAEALAVTKDFMKKCDRSRAIPTNIQLDAPPLI